MYVRGRESEWVRERQRMCVDMCVLCF